MDKDELDIGDLDRIDIGTSDRIDLGVVGHEKCAVPEIAAQTLSAELRKKIGPEKKRELRTKVERTIPHGDQTFQNEKEIKGELIFFAIGDFGGATSNVVKTAEAMGRASEKFHPEMILALGKARAFHKLS